MKYIPQVRSHSWKVFVKIGVALFIVPYSIILAVITPKVYLDTKKNSDAIVVLGARSLKADSTNPCLAARVKHASALWKEGYADTVIFTGGTDKDTNVNEAETMEKLAVDDGIPEEAVILEKEATSTYENLVNTKKIALSKNIHSFLIVTEPFHSPRASMIAARLGMNHSVSPAVESPCWTRWTFLSRFFLREPIVVLYYKATGKL